MAHLATLVRNVLTASAAAGLIGGAVAMVACGGEANDGRTTVRYARWGLPEEIAAERELLKEFEAAHPNIRVVVEFSAWSEYWNKLQAQMAAGTAPDVMLMSGEKLHDYVARDQIADMAPLLAADSSITLDAYFPATTQVYQIDGHLWAMPRDCNTIGIYYNKTLFDKHGVPYPQPGWTWEDFHAKAKALTIDENGDGRYESYGYLAAFESMEVHYAGWIWQNGGEILDPTRTHSVVDQPATVEAMRFFSDLVLKDKVSPGTAQASTFGSNMFLTGRLAMSSEGTWMVRLFSSIEGFEWDMAPLPRGKNAVAPVNGLGNAIYANTKDKQAAWELVKFMSSRPIQERLARSGTSIPAMKEVAYSPMYLDGKPAGKKLLLEQVETGRVLPFTRGWAQAETALRGELELVWLGRKDIETALKDAKPKMDAAIAPAP